MNSNRLNRVVRASVAAVLATAIALVGHILGGGQMPALIGIVIPLMISLFVAMALIGGRLALWRVSSVVVLSQLIFHWLFVLGSTGDASVAGDHMPGMQHSITGSVAVSAHTMTSPTMSFGHLAAAIFTITLVYFGERALREIVEFAIGFVRTILALAVTALDVPAAPAFVAANPNAISPWQHTTFSRRGPPHTF